MSEVIFIVVVNDIDESYTFTAEPLYQFLKGVIVGLFIFVGSNTARVLWTAAYGRIRVSADRRPPYWFTCWQDYLLAFILLAMIGLMLGLGFKCGNDFTTSTGQTDHVPGFITAEFLLHMAIGLLVAMVFQTIFMFVWGYLPQSLVDRYVAKVRSLLACHGCRGGHAHAGGPAALPLTPLSTAGADAKILSGTMTLALDAVVVHTSTTSIGTTQTRGPEPPTGGDLEGLKPPTGGGLEGPEPPTGAGLEGLEGLEPRTDGDLELSPRPLADAEPNPSMQSTALLLPTDERAAMHSDQPLPPPVVQSHEDPV